MARRRSLFKIVARAIGLAALALVCLFVGLVALYAYATPVSTLMLAREIEGKAYERLPVRLGDVAPTVIASVIASEDATFCQNDGVDWGALHEVMNSSGKVGRTRGASTITMQAAKNLVSLAEPFSPSQERRNPDRARPWQGLVEKSHARNLSQHRGMGRRNIRRRSRGAALFP